MSDGRAEFLGRIDQLDAGLLDREFTATLKKQVCQPAIAFGHRHLTFAQFFQLNSVFSLFSSSGIQPHVQFGPEMNVLLKSGEGVCRGEAPPKA